MRVPVRILPGPIFFQLFLTANDAGKGCLTCILDNKRLNTSMFTDASSSTQFRPSLASQPLLTQKARKGLVNNVACGCPSGMRMTSLNLTSLTTSPRSRYVYIFAYSWEWRRCQQRVASVWPMATLLFQATKYFVGVIDYSRCLEFSIAAHAAQKTAQSWHCLRAAAGCHVTVIRRFHW